MTEGEKKHFLCSLHYSVNNIEVCIPMNRENAVLVKVQHCQESFIGTSAKEEVCSLFTGSARDQLSRSVTPSEVSRFCQVFWHPASVVLWEMELLRFFFSSSLKWAGKKKTAFVSSPRAWNLTSPGRYIFNYRIYFFLIICDKRSVFVWNASHRSEILHFLELK